MTRITWPAVGGLIVTVASFVFFYLAMDDGQHSHPSVRTTLVLASFVGLVAGGIAALFPTKRHQMIVTAVVAVAAFTFFGLLVLPVMRGPSI